MGRPSVPKGPPERQIAENTRKKRVNAMIGATQQRETQGVKQLRSFMAGIIRGKDDNAAS